MISVSSKDWIIPDWPAPARVRSLITTRHGGVSVAPYASLNLGDHVGDDPLAVAENRARLRVSLPAAPRWLNQVHGTAVIDAADAGLPPTPVADAAFVRYPGIVCAVMTADCLPVLLCDRSGSAVAVVHAGWRGLQAGVLERTVATLGLPGRQVLAYLGPAIGPQAFEVGDDVRTAFVGAREAAAAAFKPLPDLERPAGGGYRNQQSRCSADGFGMPAKWLADIILLARQALASVGVDAIYGGGYCTLRQESRFFSYRRDGVTGRMASLIWLSAE